MTSASDIESGETLGSTSANDDSTQTDQPSERARRPARRPSLLSVAAGQVALPFEAIWSRVKRARWLGTVGAAIFVIALPVALIGTNVRVLFTSAPLYTFALDSYDVPEVTGIPREELARSMAEIRDYFTNDQE